MDTKTILALIVVVVSLFAIIANHRLNLWRTRREEYRKEYSAFSDAFNFAIQQVRSGGTTLNLVILGEYPKHEAAMSAFIHNLIGKRRQRFLEIWNEYSSIYQELSSVPGWFAATAAIIPTVDSSSEPKNLERYELERCNNILRIYASLLEVAKIGHWS